MTFFLSSSPSISLSLFSSWNPATIAHHNYKHIAQHSHIPKTKRTKIRNKKLKRTKRNILHKPISPPPSNIHHHHWQLSTTITKLQIPTATNTQNQNTHHQTPNKYSKYPQDREMIIWVIEEREASLMANPGHCLRRYQVVTLLLKVAAGYQRETKRERRDLCVLAWLRERERRKIRKRKRETIKSVILFFPSCYSES